MHCRPTRRHLRPLRIHSMRMGKYQLTARHSIRTSYLSRRDTRCTIAVLADTRLYHIGRSTTGIILWARCLQKSPAFRTFNFRKRYCREAAQSYRARRHLVTNMLQRTQTKHTHHHSQSWCSKRAMSLCMRAVCIRKCFMLSKTDTPRDCLIVITRHCILVGSSHCR